MCTSKSCIRQYSEYRYNIKENMFDDILMEVAYFLAYLYYYISQNLPKILLLFKLINSLPNLIYLMVSNQELI